MSSDEHVSQKGIPLYAVTVTAEEQPPVHIGPFIVPTNAERFAERLRSIKASRGRSLPEGLEVTVERARRSQQNRLDSRLPTEPWSLAKLIEPELETEPPFPSVRDRLIAQLGEELGVQAYRGGLAWLDYSDQATEQQPGGDEGPRLRDLVGADEQPTRRDLLAAAAEQRRAQRDEATAALKRIAVELWCDGERNIRAHSRITGLSRTTIYEALRAAGINPGTDRKACAAPS